jgi:hypothetical protein
MRPWEPADPTALAIPPLPDPGLTILRVLEGAVIDFPAPVLHPTARLWAATCWPDPRQPGGWGRALWWPSPYHRGYLPVALAFADIIEFGADIPIERRRKTRWVPVRWHGIAIEQRVDLLVAFGPYSDPSVAVSDAHELCGRVAVGLHGAD